MSRSMALLVVSALLAGCGAFAGPAGPAAPIDNVTLGGDGRSVHVDFIGGREFDVNDPCSIAYDGTAKVVGDGLEIGIYPQQHPMAQGGAVCTMEGHARSIDLSLDEPFNGVLVHDVSGQTLLLAPPPDLAVIGELPDGWKLRREESLHGSLTPRWQRIWSPDPGPWLSDRASMLTLIQAFGGPVETIGGDQISSVQVGGQPARLAQNPPSGELVLVWSLEEDELALVGNLRDFTPDELRRLAESVTLPFR